MTSEKPMQLTEQELTQEEKKRKTQAFSFRFMMGLLVGVAFGVQRIKDHS